MITGKMENAIRAASISEVISTYTRISAHPHLQVPLHLTLSHHLFFLNPKRQAPCSPIAALLFSTFPSFFIQYKKPPFSFCVFILTNEKEGKNQILALNIKFMPYYNKTYIAS